jgi:predicted phage baseplate assembly protein
MALHAPELDNLDTLRGQALIDSRRALIQRYCPEWTDYNVSDPGITLLELFAWMIEKLSYQLNQVPEKNYIKFLELLNVQLRPPEAAKTDITFYFSAPLTSGEVSLSQPIEVSTQAQSGKEPVVFTTVEKGKVLSVTFTHVYCKHADVYKGNFTQSLTQGSDPPMQAFSERPNSSDDPNTPADAFWIGFPADVSGYVLQLTFELQEVGGVGINPKRPPLVWEAWCAADKALGQWKEADVGVAGEEEDTTDGLNRSQGRLVLHLPQKMIRTSPFKPGPKDSDPRKSTSDEHSVHDRFVVRCRVRKENKETGEKPYSRSPVITKIQVAVRGVAIPATHCRVMKEDELGRSSGEPGQIFKLRCWPAPALEFDPKTEYVEVESDVEQNRFECWECRKSFDQSSSDDKHVVVDWAAAEVRFGPIIRQQNGKSQPYGEVPGFNRRIRVSQYRYGGGSEGNVNPYELCVLRTSIPGVDRATNRRSAEGGKDLQKIEDAARDARERLRAQDRMVTAADYAERVTQFASPIGATTIYPSIKRAKCIAPLFEQPESQGLKRGQVQLLVVPDAVQYPSDQATESHSNAPLVKSKKLRIDSGYKKQIKAYLDPYRSLTTFLDVRAPEYVVIVATVEVEWDESKAKDKQSVKDQLIRVLSVLISPLDVRGNPPEPFLAGLPPWREFGDTLSSSHIVLAVKQVSAVMRINSVKFAWRRVDSEREDLEKFTPDNPEVKPDQDGWTKEQDSVLITERQLPLSGRHEVILKP